MPEAGHSPLDMVPGVVGQMPDVYKGLADSEPHVNCIGLLPQLPVSIG